MSNPKLFISYSWSNRAHAKWVRDLATKLRKSGVDAILDTWDLKEGQDIFAFMEKMVGDSEINKVALISDSVYAKKADRRAGGVGVETRIISKEVYDSQNQEKFVAIVTELDKKGKPYLPAYCKHKKYINMSNPDTFEEDFEQLLRWIYDTPLHMKPDIGQRPAFLDEQDNTLGTAAAYKKAVAAVKDDERHAATAIDAYLSILSKNLEKFRITKTAEKKFDDAVVESIEKFAPYRDEAVDLFAAVAQHAPTEKNIRVLRRFFESLVHYMKYPPANTGSWWSNDFDNFKFIVHELFLCWIAVLLKRELFAETGAFLSELFYVEANITWGKPAMNDYCIFHETPVSLAGRERKLSFTAYLLEKRATNSPVLEFQHLMQADFVLYIRGELLHGHAYYPPWGPHTLVRTLSRPQVFEIFARSASKKYFERSKQVIGISKKEDLQKIPPPRAWWGEGRTIEIEVLLGYEQLATLP